MYTQVDVDGKALVPTLANFFMGTFKTKLFNTDNPSLYVCYVDDTFCIFTGLHTLG